MSTSRRMSSSWEKSFSRVIPFRRAFVAASWITGPSAIGSLKGMPISIMSTPSRARVRMTSAVPSGVGAPAQK